MGVIYSNILVDCSNTSGIDMDILVYCIVMHWHHWKRARLWVEPAYHVSLEIRLRNKMEATERDLGGLQ